MLRSILTILKSEFLEGTILGNSRNRKRSVYLKDQTALVTGASRGIGEAIARAFAAEGAQVAITGQAFNIDGGLLMV